MHSEAELIDRIRRTLPSGRAPGLLKGIGDDAAVIIRRPRAEWVVTCDALLENAHFLAAVHPPQAIGYKALARATSDIAAMGATPRFFLMSLALPASRAAGWLDAFLRGMARAARSYGMVLIGGDTSQNATLAVAITVLGEARAGRAVTRSGARPGDLVCVSGRLGVAQLGLGLVLRGLHHERRWQRLLRQHLYPRIRLALGQWLTQRRLVSAMIDTSDGLSTDLQHICEASGVGARLRADDIPRVSLPAGLRKRGFNALELALHGGEDYELLFTVPRRFEAALPRTCRGARLTPIGEVVKGRTISLVDSAGRATKLTPRGWDHFRGK